MKALLLAVAALLGASAPAPAEVGDGVIAICGASKGYAHYFGDKPVWIEDGISKGSIILVKYGKEWDIQFKDTLNQYFGYKNYRSPKDEGFSIVKIVKTDQFITVGSFSTTDTEIYTFDLKNHEVAWSINKIWTFPRVAALHAKCEYVKQGE